jgi:hypothetical protein
MYSSWRFGSRLKRVSKRASRSRIGHGQGLRVAHDSTLAGSSYSCPDKPDAAAQGAYACFGLEQTPLPGVKNPFSLSCTHLLPQQSYSEISLNYKSSIYLVNYASIDCDDPSLCPGEHVDSFVPCAVST